MVQGKFITFIVFHYDPNKYSMYTFTFLITSTTFAVTELGHNGNVMGLFLEVLFRNGGAFIKHHQNALL